MVDRGRTNIVLECDVQGLVADAAALDALARVALIARRTGAEMRVRNASPQLLELLDFAALAEAVGVD